MKRSDGKKDYSQVWIIVQNQSGKFSVFSYLRDEIDQNTLHYIGHLYDFSESSKSEILIMASIIGIDVLKFNGSSVSSIMFKNELEQL